MNKFIIKLFISKTGPVYVLFFAAIRKYAQPEYTL